jgi:hypothetical protein
MMKNRAYFTTWGPSDGPILFRDHAPVMSLVRKPNPVGMDACPVGTAQCIGWLEGTEPPVALFRLVVGHQELPGHYVCDRRRLVALEPRSAPFLVEANP